MNYAQRLELWGNRHHPKWLDIVRIGLGIFLFIKGIELLYNNGFLIQQMNDRLSFNAFALILLSHYVVFSHLLGGFLLALGLLTRVAALIQIPVLLGAVIFINSSGDVFKPFSEFWLSIVVLLLLILFLIVGNGPWSFDWFVKHDKKQ
jgi:uncharacterized membrane protein YphA (DoxX/SURF4 family)